MTPVERCGIPNGVARHRARGEDPCESCLAARRAYDRNRRRIERGHIPGPRIPGGIDFPAFALEPDIACGGSNPELFFPAVAGERAAVEEAKAIRVCSLCPHLDACRQWAVATRQGRGIWGGTTPDQRREIIKRGATTR